MSRVHLQEAILDWKRILAPDEINVNEDDLRRVVNNCLGVQRGVLAVLYPSTLESVVKLVQIAHEYEVPLYPVSTGNNWGYGAAVPVVEGCVLVHLSRMNRIVEFDEEAGVVTLEPGVTQGDLHAYLKRRGLPYLVPVTGAGPACSLVGNALEHGYGVTPNMDHFGAVMDLQAVLPNGELYSSMINNLGGEEVGRCFKWGVGPVLDGIFSQGNFGVVTRMSIALAPMPERVEVFYLSVSSRSELELVTKRIQRVLRRVGGVMGSINLMNQRRVLSMIEPYPENAVSAGGVISDNDLLVMAKRNQISEWTSIGAIYGDKAVVKAVKGVICQELNLIAKRLTFFTEKKIDFLSGVVNGFPLLRRSNLSNILNALRQSMKLFMGEPSEVALPLAYWRSGSRGARKLNPANDGCGLIWYAPLVAMKSESVRRYVKFVERVCIKYGIEPLITLTSLSDRCWDSTVPILFDRSNAVEVQNAQQCYRELLSEGLKQGFVPYRVTVDAMNILNEGVPAVLKTIKQAIDPKNIIAPGRYGV